MHTWWMDAAKVRALAASGETMTCEYKRGQGFNDKALVETVACMANGPGGTILIGVEDDGNITGAPARHGDRTDPDLVRALILNRTLPPLATDVAVVPVADVDVIAIQTPSATTPVGTSTGVYRRRTVTTEGKPTCIPYGPQEMFSSYFSLSGRDYAEVEARGATMSDLDPQELHLFRRLAAQGAGDRTLATLADDEIARALGVARLGPNNELELTLGAILLFGTEASLRSYVPTAEMAFQELDGTAVRANEVHRTPLLRAAEELHTLVMTRNREEEVSWGMLRIAVPTFPGTVVREAIANALVHRDYAESGPVTVRLSSDELRIDNPGGFPPGVTLQNLLDVSKPRSRTLADTFKRAGLVERSGRGVSRMHEGLLRIGREAPDYSRSTGVHVAVSFSTGHADLEMARFIAASENESGHSLSLNEMRVLHEVRAAPSATTRDLSGALNLPDGVIRHVVARLVELGVVEARGTGRGRRYHLSAAFYRYASDPAAYVRLRGTDEIQQQQMVVQYATSHGRITRSEAADLCMISPQQATNLLRRLVGEGRLERRGERRGAHYVVATA